MDIHSLYAFVQPLFRRRRMRRFVTTFRPNAETRILDVGGYPADWSESSLRARFTIVNVHDPNLGESAAEEWNFTIADGRHLPFEDRAFDIGFSNSVVEHLSTYRDQELFAREIMRVARHIWVQTPAKWFPIEPHLLTPFVHYFPRRLRRRLLRFTVWGLIAKPSREQRDAFLEEVRLLSYGEMRRLFPGCRVLREKVLFVTKSYIAVR